MTRRTSTFTRRSSRAARSLSRAERRAGGMIDALEPRRLLAGIINGTNGDDTFVISVGENNAITVIFNGTPQGVSPSADGDMEVHGLGGNDTISLLNSGTLRFFLFGEQGDDHFNIGNGRLETDILRDVLIIEPSGIGNDTCVINDQFGGGTAYTIDDDSVSILSLTSPSIVLPSMVEPGDGATILGSNGPDTLSVQGGFPRRTLFDLGAGDDTVRLGGSQNMVPPNLPASSRITGGLTGDTLLVNDSNPASPRADLRFDDGGLAGQIRLDDFNIMKIETHQPAGNLPQPVTFRGGACLAPFVTITGTAGPDLVQLGEPGNGIFARLYADHFNLDLGTGQNRVELHEQPTGDPNNWRLTNTQLVNDSGGPMSLSTIQPLPIELFLNGTNNDDVYTIEDTPDLWAVEIDGRGGNDLLQMGALKDLDDVFDTVKFKFVGGAGTDTMNLSDIHDELGSADDYRIGDFISKGPFGTTTSAVLEHSFVDNLILHLNNDPNRLFFDLAAFQDVEIFGNGGSDTFFNRDETITAGRQFVHTFAANMTFHGGSGNNVLSLDDGDGRAGLYALESDSVGYSLGSQVKDLLFTGMGALDLFTSAHDDIVQLREKPAGTLSFGVGAGNDTVIVGGGDLDSRGWMSAGFTLSGDAGMDEIIFDDSLDGVTAGETESYTFGSFVLTKGSAGITYGAFEEQTLLAADGGAIPFQPSTINLNAVSGQVEFTTITGGANRPNVVNVGSAQIPNIGLAINLGAAGGTINFNDQNVTAARTYDIGATGMTSPAAVSFGGASAVNVNGGQGNDNFFVRGSSAAMLVNGGIGNDVMTVGSGFGNYSAPVTVNGQVGTDVIRFNGTSEAELFVGTLRSNSFAAHGITHPYTGFESVVVQTGGSGSDITIHSLVTLNPPDISSTTFAGGGGDDLIRFGTGNVVNTLTGNVSISGGGGDDTLVIDDSSGSSARDYTFDQGNRFFRGSITQASVVRTSIERTILEATNGRNVVTVDGSSTPLTIRANGGNDSVNVLDATSAVTVDTGPETASTTAPFGDSLAINADFATAGDTAATVIVSTSDAILGLTLAQAGVLRIAAGGVLEKSAATGSTLTLDGTLDLAGGALLSRAGGPTPPQFRNRIIAGRNGGAWNGTAAGAIQSSLAASSPIGDGVGYGLGSEVAPTTIGGFAIAAGDTLLRYTLDGDADLDGTTGIADFSRVAVNFNGIGKVWTTGDGDYDGKADISDFSMLAAAFNQSAAGGAGLPQARARVRTPFATSGRIATELLVEEFPPRG